MRVTFTDDRGHAETLTSAATSAVVARGNARATGAPTITGTAQVGQTLSRQVHHGHIGLRRADKRGLQLSVAGRRRDISGATGSSYTLADAEEGKAIKVRVTFTDDRSNAETLTSAATSAVEARPNTAATGAPTISGTAQVGETLTADTSGIGDADGLTNAAYSYQWVRNDGTSDTDIQCATAASYTMVADDQDKTIKVRVSFTDDRGHTETLVSAATGTVAAGTSPLKACMHSAPESHDGSATFTFELHFNETPKDGFSYRTLRDHAFTLTGGEVTKVRRLEAGNNLEWEITVDPSGNGDVTVVLPVTTDCTANGAICATGGKMLSEQVELTVTGPDG